jgi:hypothetical protein
MRFDVNRICELAGIGAASGGLMNEAVASTPPAKPAPGAKPAPAPTATTKPSGQAPAKPAPGAKAPPAAEGEEHEGYHLEEMGYEEGYGMHEMGYEEGYGMHEMEIEDGDVYEIDEYALMEALVDMRQRRLEETQVRDTVRDEIRRALSDRSGSWVYGANKPTNSKQGQISRGGFGIGFGFRR